MSKWGIFAGVMLILCSGLSALGQVRSCELDTAIPHSGLGLVYSSAIKGSGLEDLEGISRTDLGGSVYGVRGSKKLSSRWQISGALYQYAYGKEVELQTKHLLRKTPSTYLSLAPSVYYSLGVDENNHEYPYADENKCWVKGFGIPLIFTEDTHRNLLINVSAGINCDWVFSSLKDTIDPYTDHPSIVHDSFPTEFTWRGHTNIGLEARSGNGVLTPEIGLSWVDAHGKHIRIVPNFGVSLGISPGK